MKAAEFARCYGSAKRCAWIRDQPCVRCSSTPCVNAHVRVDGMGRKGPYQQIVPMCSTCDRVIGTPAKKLKRWFLARAEETEARWQACVNKRGVP